MKRLLYWVWLLIGITACVNSKGEDMLAEAERLMLAYPDSALSLLEQAEKESATYPRRNRMRRRKAQPIRAATGCTTGCFKPKR